MDDEDDIDEEDAELEAGSVAPDLVKSYLAFVKRAVMARRALTIVAFLVAACLVVAVTLLLPRTYHCESRLFAQGTQGLHDDSTTRAMWGASDLILRQENLDAIVKETDLVRLWYERRAPILHLKDVIMERLRGKPDPKYTAETLRWELQQRLGVETSDSNLTLSIDWPDAQTAPAILEAAQRTFLEARHHQEIAQLADYIAILERHATRLRGEVTTLAQQMSAFQNEQIDAAKKKIESATAQAAPHAPATSDHAAPPRPRAAAPDPAANEELAEAKEALELKRKDLSNQQDARRGRVQDLRTKLAELETTYTDAHPAVLETKANILKFSKESQDELNLKSDIAALEGRIKALTSASMAAAAEASTGYANPSGGGSDSSAGTAAAPLPKEIMNLMQDHADNVDPAVRAQFLYSVSKYSDLRNQIGTARIQLDTAQAAFNDRYKVIVQPEVPTKASKPKIPVMLVGGLALSLLLALALPLIAELRTGKIVEQWQVQSLALPILAELRFPPGSSDSGAE